jgi:hypothetical protein
MGSDGFVKNEPKLKILPDGTRKWWLNGELHRQDGPAVEWSDGSREWYLNGELHRQDGPAIELPNGTCAWWLNGKRFKNCERFLKALEKTVSEKRFQEIKSLLEIWEVMDL